MIPDLPVDQIARSLLGSHLRTEIDGTPTEVMLTEVEAYGAEDPASHSFRGARLSNQTMFETAGTLYVYLSCGAGRGSAAASRDSHRGRRSDATPQGSGRSPVRRAGQAVPGTRDQRYPQRNEPGDWAGATDPSRIAGASGDRDTTSGDHEGDRSTVEIRPGAVTFRSLHRTLYPVPCSATGLPWVPGTLYKVLRGDPVAPATDSPRE